MNIEKRLETLFARANALGAKVEKGDISESVKNELDFLKNEGIKIINHLSHNVQLTPVQQLQLYEMRKELSGI